ncbi:Crp/Fnr family transcriptional regulator [Pseudogracilibacillus sp. ICA-222130]|uniref:Crp/Fnr family transcriptional regulator n=1 Tax=Pseudogracilibacillus sp. ICA-222130 TaxID=3134655 RepID=UPI0030C5E3BE
MIERNKQGLVPYLKKIHLFSHMDESSLEQLAFWMNIRTMRKGTHVFFKDDPMLQLFFIVQGKVKIYEMDVSGREQIINILKEGEMFPHRGMFEEQQDYPANAVIYEEAQILTISKDEFSNMLLQFPSIAIEMLKMQNKLIDDLHVRLNEKMMHDAREQIIKLLLRLTQSHGVDLGDNHYKLTTAFTNQELANMIGTSRETISRTLTNFKKKKYIYESDDGHLVIDFHLIHEEVLY